MARTICTTPLILYVNPSKGNNANDGFTPSTALKTLQYAHDSVIKKFDLNGMPATIQGAPGYTYSENLQAYSQPLGHHLITLRGDPANPGHFRWLVGANETICSVTDYGCVQLDGWELASTGAGAKGLATSQHAIGDIQHCLTGSFPGGNILFATQNSLINVTGPMIVAGNCDSFATASAQSRVYLGGQAISVPYGGIEIADAFAVATADGMIDFGGQVIFSGAGLSRLAGKQYDAQIKSLILLGGTMFPLSMSAGTCDGTSTVI